MSKLTMIDRCLHLRGYWLDQGRGIYQCSDCGIPASEHDQKAVYPHRLEIWPKIKHEEKEPERPEPI